MSKLYRLVSDYGYGDRTWTHRFLSEEDVLDCFKTFSNWSTRPTLEEAMSSEGIYSVEEDNEDDVEDWDWQSS
jgi:hypothetical protein